MTADASREQLRAERQARDQDPVIVRRPVEVPQRLGCLVSWAESPRDARYAGAVWGSLDLDAEPSTKAEARAVVLELRSALAAAEPTPDWDALLYGGGPEELRRRVASAALWVVQCMEADDVATAAA